MTLEELLNKLIEKGWKPFGYENVYIETYDENTPGGYVILRGKKYGTYEVVQNFRPYRFICAKESGLWQFVCENRMVGRGDRITKRKKVKDTDSRSGEEVIYYSVIGSYNETDYQYRLIESALKDESELEEFLLNSIIIDD